MPRRKGGCADQPASPASSTAAAKPTVHGIEIGSRDGAGDEFEPIWRHLGRVSGHVYAAVIAASFTCRLIGNMPLPPTRTQAWRHATAVPKPSRGTRIMMFPHTLPPIDCTRRSEAEALRTWRHGARFSDRASAAVIAAVDRQRDAGDELRGRRREEDRRTDGSPALQCRPLGDALLVGRALP